LGDVKLEGDAVVVDTKMVKTAGEHTVCAALARHGWAPALTRDGIARTDILAVGTHLPDRPTVELQVKSATQAGTRTSWQINDKAQQPARSQHEWFAFVLLPTPPKPARCFVVPRDHVAAATWAVHMNWLTHPEAAPGTRNAPLSRARMNDTVWGPYEDRWDLLSQPGPEVAVLLPDFVRKFMQLERVGLPPSHPWRSQPPEWLE
jgi:hypothetical protein